VLVLKKKKKKVSIATAEDDKQVGVPIASEKKQSTTETFLHF